MSKLAANFVRTAPAGKHSDGGGLYLLITGRDARGKAKGSWIFRYTYLKQRYEMGLGSVQTLSLAQARSERDRWRDQMTDRRSPVNPIEEKRRLEAEAAGARKARTLNDIAPIAFERLKPSLKDDGKAGRWYSPLELYVLPALGAMPVEKIHQRDIEQALAPIWHTKSATATKAIQRLSAVLKHAAAMGLDVDLNAIPNARQLLGDQRHKVRHHPALPWQDIPAFFQSLDDRNTVQRALKLYILVGGGPRLKPLRTARFEQFDDQVWELDGELMKGRQGKADAFRIPVTSGMQRLLEISREQSPCEYVFPTSKPRRGQLSPISDQAIENVMRRSEGVLGWREPYRPHGIRSTFRSWVSEVDPSLYAVAETALAHHVGGIVERTYARNDFLEQRRELLERWAEHLRSNDN